MALYKYLAAGKNQPAKEIVIEADSEKDARSRMRGRGLTVIKSFGEVSGESGKKSFSSFFGPTVDVNEFTDQLTPLLVAHIPLERSLLIMGEGATNPAQKEFINSLREGLHEGKKFSALIRSYGGKFPGFYANLIETGEESGCLPEVMVELRRFMAERKELRDFVVSSSIYPGVILSVTLIVTVVLFTVFVPTFAKIFTDMGRDMPPSMAVLMDISAFFSWAWWLIPLLLIAGGAGFYKYMGKERMNLMRDKFLLRLPAVGKVVETLEICRFIQTLSILIRNHVEIIRTVKIAIRVLQNRVIRDDFSGLEAKLKSGEHLSGCLRDSRFMPRNVIQMVRVGEESGTVGEMLGDIAGQQEREVRAKIKRMLSLFEPAVIIILAGVVLLVVVSIFMAIMDLNSIQ